MEKSYTLRELAELVGGRIAGDPETIIKRVRPFDQAGAEDIALAAERKYLGRLAASRAAALIVPPGTKAAGTAALLEVRQPKLAFARLLELFHSEPYRPRGISPLAAIGENTRIGSDVTIGHYAVIGDNCRIGNRVRIGALAAIGDGVEIGDDTTISASVTIYSGVRIGSNVIIHSGTVIGADGFGYVFDGERQVKIPQVGGVEIQDEVEIGANCAIDRATLGLTVIGKGVKIDNFVHVGHNSTVGENSIIVAQVGLSGGTRVGRGVTMAGQSATHQHVTIGDGAIVTGQAGVTKSVKPGRVVSGTPAIDHNRWRRAQVLVARLPEIYRELKALAAELRNRR